MPWLSTGNNITGTQKFVSVESLERFSMLALSRTLSRLALQASQKSPLILGNRYCPRPRPPGECAGAKAKYHGHIPDTPSLRPGG